MAFRYRLRPDVSQLSRFERHCADARFVWNLAESARPDGPPASFPVELPQRLIEIYPYPSVSSRPIRSMAVLAVVYRISGETERQFGALGSLG